MDSETLPPPIPPTPPVPNADDPPGRSDIIEIDCTCARCGYMLKGLPRNVRCPECGWEIENSLRGNLYCYSPVDFVERLHRGAVIAEIAVLSTIPVMIVGGILSAIVESTRAGVTAGRFISSIVGSICYIAMLYGLWLLSSPDPSGDPSRDPRSRRVLRVTLIVAACSALIQPLLSITGGVGGIAPSMAGNSAIFGSTMRIVSFVGSCVLTVALLVQWIATMNYARRMAIRVPDRLLDRRAKFLLWGPIWSIVGLLLLAAIAAGIAYALSANAGNSSLGIAVIIFPFCGGILVVLAAVLLFYIIYAMLLDRMRSMLGLTLLNMRRSAGYAVPSYSPLPIMQPPAAPPIDGME